jgi:DMSO/TMAO reductase YedYZ molybdopterin-dependent catalytic subunit
VALRVDGLVERPVRFTPGDLAGFPQGHLTADFECLEGWTAPALHWEGVPLEDLLERVGVAPAARWVQASAGGYSVPLPLDDARRGLLALRLGGAPLSPEQGAPVRLVVPGHACYTSIKWLDHLELRAAAGPDTGQAAARERLAEAEAERGRLPGRSS